MDLRNIKLTRRSLLKLGRSTLLVAGMASFYPVYKFLSFPKNTTSEFRVSKTNTSLSPEWSRVAQSRFWLRELGGQVEGIWATCTHLGCEVHFVPSAKTWICPCHGSHYDTEGQPISGPAKKSLARLTVQGKDGEYVLMPPT